MLQLAALAALVLLAAGCGRDGQEPAMAKASPPATPPAVSVKVAAVVERPVVEQVSFIATVEASITTTVGAEVAGQVVAAPVREGERVVAERTVLAEIDTGPRAIQLREAMAVVAGAREELAKLRRGYREEEVAQREAEVAAQKALLDRAEGDWRRGQELYRGELISRAELQRWESEYLAARAKHRQLTEALRMARAGPRPEEIARAAAELDQARARVDRIQDEIRRSTIRAPLSGFVVKKRADVGAWVQPGSPVADLVVLDPVFVTGPVGEREIRRVRHGQPASIALDAHPGRTFQGTVTAIIPGADPASRTFPVRVTVANPGGLLRAGMFARVTVRTGEGRAGLFVPRDAVVRRGGRELVFVVNDDRAHLVRVETGVEAENLVEVRAPELRAGQTVVTLGNEFLQPGTRVEAIR